MSLHRLIPLTLLAGWTISLQAQNLKLSGQTRIPNKDIEIREL